jgi:tetratricopeptide (TPR) repeat protein
MDAEFIFISHASKDDEFVKDLRLALEGQGLSVWADSRNLRGGDKLAPEIEQAIEQARQVIAVLSTNTINSLWVRKEIQKALEVEKRREDEGYRVIPLLLPGVEPSALPLWFDEEPVGVRVELKTGGVSEALPAILAALGERLPTDYQPPHSALAKPVEELLLELSDPKIQITDGKRRASATATMIYQPADGSAREVESKRFTFTAPLGPIEADDLCWYLEEYFRWPTGVFTERAKAIEEKLPQWGQELFVAASMTDSAKEVLNAWLNEAESADRRFSVMVDSDLPEGASEEDQVAAREAASLLLSLPWELLHDGRGFLFHGKNPVRVRRRLPNRHPQPVTPSRLPIRILLVSPRPEGDGSGYIDHRISAKPLVEAIESLGEQAELTILSPPTFPALEEALQRAADENEPFDVVHFDGHGVYDRKIGLGALCFEDPKDADKLERRAMQLVHAEKLAAVVRDHRIPLVFLDACQSAQTEEDPTASVAAKLLEEGVTSVVAMSHSVLVETARRFVTAFYAELARGARVGTAMLAGQRALVGDTYRGKIMGAGELHLQDWFVPVLYQEEQDPQLITQLPSEQARQLQQRSRQFSLGALPATPTQGFIGRSRELLALERVLDQTPRDQAQRYAVVRGVGGQGKTTLAVELARWLVRTGRFRRAAFVSLEHYSDARGVLDSLGRQLLPEGDKWSVAQYSGLKQALQPVERALIDYPTLIVLDNLESVLPSTNKNLTAECAEDAEKDSETLRDLGDLGGSTEIEEIFRLCRALLDAHPATRLLFTSREPLPAPFNHRRCDWPLQPLSRADAIELVSQVMVENGLTPQADDPGGTPKEIEELVEAVNCHARALVLLAREIAQRGVRATTENLRKIMAELHRRHPDDRENSLYASVELSLRRLPPQMREQVKALGVFHGGANIVVLGMMLETDPEAVFSLARQLIEVGLAEGKRLHLRLDPSLPPYLLQEMSDTEQERLRSRWAEGMIQVAEFLYKQRFEDTRLASQLTLLELSNLMALLRWIQSKMEPERVADVVDRVEGLLAPLGHLQALAEVKRVRETIARELRGWSHTRFHLEDRSIERLLDRGELQSAYIAAQQLRRRCLDAGDKAYPEAAYDIALAHLRLGEVLSMVGAAEAALQFLSEARDRFHVLAGAGNTDAERMVSVAISDCAHCLRDLGRLDDAAMAYEEAISRYERIGAAKDVAVDKANLATIRILQERYDQALMASGDAREIFERLNDPRSLATSWHHIGIIYKHLGQFEHAEQAYRQALAISVQQKDPIEVSSLIELGSLYGIMGRLEMAMNFYRQAADISATLKDPKREGMARSGLAIALIELQRFDEARCELQRAIECEKPFGHAAQPWKIWNILHNLEQATGNAQAAARAREQAIAAYLAYRRAGGASQSGRPQLYALVSQAIEQGATTEAANRLAELSSADDPPWFTLVLAKLQAILRGDRRLALADDPNLLYMDAAELHLLLEALRTE